MADNTNGGSLLDEVMAQTGRSGSSGCMVATFIDQQPNREEWVAILANGELQTSAIHRVAVPRGFTGGKSTLARHRKGECTCRA